MHGLHAVRKYLWPLCFLFGRRSCVFYIESIKENVKNIKGRAVYPVIGGVRLLSSKLSTLTTDSAFLPFETIDSQEVALSDETYLNLIYL